MKSPSFRLGPWFGVLMALGLTSLAQAQTLQKIFIRGTVSGTGVTCQLDLGTDAISAVGGVVNGYTSLYPGREYQLSLYAENLSSATLNLVAPNGYRFNIDGVQRSRIVVSAGGQNPLNQVYTVILESGAGGSPGTSPGVSLSDDIAWGVNLGRLYNGTMAGAVIVRQSTISNNIYDRSALHFSGLGGQVAVLRDLQGRMRQIVAPEVFVDVTDLSPAPGFRMDFYPLTAVGPLGADNLRQIAQPSQKYISYTLRPGAEAGTLAVEQMNGTESNLQMVQRTAGTWLRSVDGDVVKEQRDSVQIEPDTRVETVTVKNNNNVLARKTVFTYKKFAWNTPSYPQPDELVKVEAYATASTVAQVTHYDYYTDATKPGSYKQIKSVIYPNGNWVKYEYYEDADRRGELFRKYTPWLDSPASPDEADPSFGVVVTYNYATDWNGTKTLLSSEETRVNGFLTGKVTIANTTNGNANSLALWSRTIKTYTADTAETGALTSEIKTYQPNQLEANSRYNGLIHSQTSHDQTKVSYVHQHGVYDAATGVFTPQDANATAMREIALQGTARTDIGTNLTSYAGKTIDSLNLVANRSTMTVKIRQNGRLLLEEAHVYATGGSFEKVGWTKYEYTDSGKLTRRTTSSGTVYEATWVNEFKTQETTETGLTYLYSPDLIQRVQTVVKLDAPSLTHEGTTYLAQLAATTGYVYNAAGDVLSTTTAGGGITLGSSATYDLAGRMTSSTDENGVYLTYGYNLAARETTVTKPDNSTLKTKSHVNGLTEKLFGTGRTAEFFDYAYDGATGFLITTASRGSLTSPATTIAITDWLGRTLEQRAPVPDASGTASHATSTSEYNWLGQLTKVTATGQNPVLYVYDELGALVRQGLDVNNDNALTPASLDRISDFSRAFYKDANNHWWTQEQTRAYPRDNDAFSVLVAQSRSRLNGFANGYVAETRSLDAQGNEAVSQTLLNRANRLVVNYTDLPGVANDYETVAYNGLQVESIDPLGQSIQTTYDALGRPVSVVHPRKGTIQTTYVSNKNLVAQTNYLNSPTPLAAYQYDSSARLIKTTDGLGNFTAQGYDGCSCGRVSHVWGSNTQPVAYVYDNLGRLQDQITYRSGAGFTSWNNGTLPSDFTNTAIQDKTSFAYYGDSSFLKTRTDAQNRAIDYAYDGAGRLTQEKLARTRSDATRLERNAAYSAVTGELTGTTYNDGTTAIAYTYTRLGQVKTVSDVTGTRSFDYDTTTGLLLTQENLPAYFGTARKLSYSYDSDPGEKGRPTQFALMTGTTVNQTMDYGYTNNAQLQTLTAGPGGQTSRVFTYGYVTDQPTLVQSVAVNALGYSVSRTYDTEFDLVQSITTAWNTNTIQAKHEYTFNARGQRLSAKQSGAAFADYGPNNGATFYLYDYNARGELTTAAQYLGTNITDQSQSLPGRKFEYGYDAMGNRTSANNTGVSGLAADYTPNNLNQITSKENHNVHMSGTGVAGMKVATTTPLASQPAYRGNFWSLEVGTNNQTSASKTAVTLYAGKAGLGAGGKDAITSDSRAIFLPPALETLTYDEDGNLKTDGRWEYFYDAKNQLIRMETRSGVISILEAVAGGERARKLEFTYDYQGRRVAKTVYGWNSATEAWVLNSESLFLYQGFNVIAELANDASKTIRRQFFWGLDVTGTLTGAGGVGALLMIQDGGVSYFPSYDGNGNVTSLTDSTGTIRASYEYSPFGELLRVEGTYATENPFRFSTKWTDDETGLVYYGLRYYSPAMGRFVNRDPIMEQGGINVYGFVGNDPVNWWDYRGLDGDSERLPDREPPPRTSSESGGVIRLPEFIVKGDRVNGDRFTAVPAFNQDDINDLLSFINQLNSSNLNRTIHNPEPELPQADSGVILLKPFEVKARKWHSCMDCHGLPWRERAEIGLPQVQPWFNEKGVLEAHNEMLLWSSLLLTAITDGLIRNPSIRGAQKSRSSGTYRPNQPLPRDAHGKPVPTPGASGPHTQIGTARGRNGDYTQAREFDVNGNPVRDIDFTDHGRPNVSGHTNPHQHLYVPNPTGGTPQRGPAEPLL